MQRSIELEPFSFFKSNAADGERERPRIFSVYFGADISIIRGFPALNFLKIEIS